ncbi:MAG: glycosyltransferase family 2 protein [Chloroflexota bacterium]|nr:MAG: glycosyltransferase family 2 protein [Chloroflexota bacterium]
MTTWLFCLFGNEEQLMPYFLRHYAPQVDQLIMLDGGSTDGSRALIRACPNAEVQDSPFRQGGYDEYACVDFLARKTHNARGRADWVLIVDADEFVYTPQGLPSALAELRRQGGRAVKATGYQMVAETFPASAGALTDLVRKGVRDPEYDKLVAFDPCLDVSWSPGRHNCRIGAPVAQPGMMLLHYRYFGEAYLRDRNARIFARRGADDIAKGRAYHSAPDHQGKYSLTWWQHAASVAEDVL